MLTRAEQYLLSKIREGDSEGWSQLVDRYQGRLLSFAKTQLRNVADAEDIVQDTFIGFLKGMERFRGDSSLETFLFSILRRRIIDSYRKRRISSCSLQDQFGSDSNGDSRELAGLLESPVETASVYARKNEMSEQLRHALGLALGDLVERYRQTKNFRNLQVAELLFYVQLRNKEIAGLLKLEESQVALLKHRFVNRLARLVEELLNDKEITALDFERQNWLAKAWESRRPSCPKRSTIGAYMLNTLDDPWREYVTFHLDTVGCRFCQANHEDLKNQQEQMRQPAALHEKIMQSTIGFLSRVD